jgi:hypothetical protein
MEKGIIRFVVFNDEDFGYWNNQRRDYLLSQGRAIWDIVQTRYVIPAMLENANQGEFLSLSLSGGDVHHQDPLRLECRLVPWWCMRLDHGSVLLTSELASPWHCLLLDGGLPSTGLRLLPPLMSVALHGREAYIRPRCRHPWWNCRGDLSGQSILHPWCGCDRSGQSPCDVTPGRGVAEAPHPT